MCKACKEFEGWKYFDTHEFSESRCKCVQEEEGCSFGGIQECENGFDMSTIFGDKDNWKSALNIDAGKIKCSYCDCSIDIKKFPKEAQQVLKEKGVS